MIEFERLCNKLVTLFPLKPERDIRVIIFIFSLIFFVAMQSVPFKRPEKDQLEAVKQVAQLLGVTLVRKGASDIIADNKSGK